MSAEVRCSFELRTASSDHSGRFVYTRLWLDGYHGKVRYTPNTRPRGVDRPRRARVARVGVGDP